MRSIFQYTLSLHGEGKGGEVKGREGKALPSIRMLLKGRVGGGRALHGGAGSARNRSIGASIYFAPPLRRSFFRESGLTLTFALVLVLHRKKTRKNTGRGFQFEVNFHCVKPRSTEEKRLT